MKTYTLQTIPLRDVPVGGLFIDVSSNTPDFAALLKVISKREDKIHIQLMAVFEGGKDKTYCYIEHIWESPTLPVMYTGEIIPEPPTVSS